MSRDRPTCLTHTTALLSALPCRVVATADEQLLLAHQALVAGEYEQALAAALQSVGVEDQALAHRLLGGLYYLEWRVVEAQREWELAFRTWRNEGQLRPAAQTAIDLAGLHADALGHLAAGQGWAERARRLLERIGPCVEWGYLELAYIACDRTDVDGCWSAPTAPSASPLSSATPTSKPGHWPTVAWAWCPRAGRARASPASMRRWPPSRPAR